MPTSGTPSGVESREGPHWVERGGRKCFFVVQRLGVFKQWFTDPTTLSSWEDSPKDLALFPEQTPEDP